MFGQRENGEAYNIPAILVDKGMMADGTRRIFLYLQEGVSDEDMLKIMKVSGKHVQFGFIET